MNDISKFVMTMRSYTPSERLHLYRLLHEYTFPRRSFGEMINNLNIYREKYKYIPEDFINEILDNYMNGRTMTSSEELI